MHAIVKAETKDNLRCAIEFFKSNNLCWRKIQMLITDKAFHKKAALGERFPEARQLLEHKEKLNGALSTLVISTSKVQYERGKQYLLKLLGGDKTHVLYDDFIKNWHDCKEEWVLYERGNVPHLGNLTNNRLDLKWGKLKQLVNKNYSIFQQISALILFQEVAEDEYLHEYHRARKMKTQAICLSHELKSLAFDLASAEFTYATSGRADYQLDIGNDGGALKSRRTGDAHHIYTCDCIFSQTLLPCRHVMFYRLRNLNETVLPPLISIAQRWMRGCIVNDISQGDIGRGHVELKPFSGGAMSEGYKYSEAQTCMEKMTAVLTAQRTPTYKAAVAFLEDFT
ncbi:hypothetical protein PHMEG_00023139 [Phytophthora megakarya]|uniref:ZSWIM1/3 RNaseH-like domain-containing protein n=1 Tax=Phytophthora megakarya TaxID=4795 RepID=A0A225VIF4_9STRA|nr:hypothetical protein PHMEG_00023139 [Phytophthora megakarya]